MKLHRKMKHEEKVCSILKSTLTSGVGSYARGQGRSQVKGQNCAAHILLKQI